MPLQERYQNLTRRERKSEWMRMLRESREHPESAGRQHCRYGGAWLCWRAWSKVTGCTRYMRQELNQAWQNGLMEPPGGGREEHIVREKPASSDMDNLFLFCYQCLAEPLADENFTVETDASLQDFLDRHSMNFCSEWGGAVLDPRTDLVTLSACVAQEATDSRLEKRWLPPHPAPPTL